MKKTIIILVASLLAFYDISHAIKPSATYKYTPKELGVQFEEMRINTKDGASLNVWHLPSEGSDHPVIISGSDAGNMGDWLYLGYYLQYYGVDVWLYDYRGFGSSSAFEIKQPYLFYTEFITDLFSVVEYVHSASGKTPILFGISMGTIIVEEYLKRAETTVCAAIFDGFVHDPFVWKERLAAMGKTIIIPNDFNCMTGNVTTFPRLYIVAKNDTLSKKEDIPDKNINHVWIKSFKCGHIEAFFKYPKQYTRLIYKFVKDCR